MRAFFHLVLLACSLQAVAQTTSLTEHIRLAQHAQSQQDCATAAREYRMAVRLMPTSAELHSNEGVALYCDGQLSPAGDAFRKALALKPALFAPHLFLGLTDFRMGSETAALQELETATRLNPSDSTAHLWLGYAYVAAGRYENAIEQFDSVLTADSHNPDARYALGESWFEIGRRKARQLAELAPHGPYLLRLATEQRELMHTSEHDKVTPAETPGVVASNLPAATADPRESEEKSLYLESHEAERKAESALSAVLRDTPDSDRAHQILADIALSRDQLDEAIAEYRKVLEISPDLPGIHEAISNCLMRQYHPADALAELRSEEKLQPHSSQVQTEIARVQLDMGATQEASVSLQKAVSLGEVSATTYALLGKAALRMHNAQAAIEPLKEAIAKDPRLSIAYYLLATAYRSMGDRARMNEALKMYQQLSQDEHQRQAAERALRKPDAAPPLMNADEKRDADALAIPAP